MKPLIVGLCGPAGSGKDEVGRNLFQYGCVRISFAEPVYEAVSKMTGVPVERLSDRATKETVIPEVGRSPRELLQGVGKWARDNIHPDVWVWTAKKKASIPLLMNLGIVFTDVRYQNELEYIKSLGGVLWRVRRPGAGLAGETAKHETESGEIYEQASDLIENKGTIEDLHAAVDDAVRRLLDGTIRV